MKEKIIFTKAEIVIFRKTRQQKKLYYWRKSERTILENKKCQRNSKKKMDKYRKIVKWYTQSIIDLEPQSWSKKGTLYRVYTRELDRAPKHSVFILYIYFTHSLYYTILVYPKETYIYHCTCCITSLFQNLLQHVIG